MNHFIQLSISGLSMGVIYALIALGFVVIYRASKVFNFAHGDLLVFGAFTTVALQQLGLPWVGALLLAMAATGMLSAFIERTVLRPLVGRPIFVPIIITIFVGFLIRLGLIMFWGPEPYGIQTPWDVTSHWQLQGVSVLYNSLAALVAGVVALVLFWLLLQRSRFGVAMRAVSADQEAALSLGLPVGRILGGAWFVAGAYACLAGVFLAMFPRNVDINLAYIALSAFPAVLVGGLESARGAVIAGLGLGILQVLAQGYINPLLGDFGHNFHVVFPYVVMIVFLVIRPYGLFGEREIKRV